MTSIPFPTVSDRVRATPARRSRAGVYVLSRGVVCAVLVGAIGTLFYHPTNPVVYALDVLFRSWVTFLGTVMAHEGTHGHLGRSKAANFWWGRLSLIPTLVPFTNFCKTHNLHHLHTNDPDKDPDHFMNGPGWQLPFRALAMPHQWFFWLNARGRIQRRDVTELALNYVGIFAVYGIVGALVGWSRLLSGVGPALVIVSLTLWYPFAFKTHEGFSTGSAEARSHNYYGRFMYWFSLGLSLHREHHMKPALAWIELHPLIEESPDRSWRRFLPRRDIKADA
jgi:beta-carotene hydroxylase